LLRFALFASTALLTACATTSPEPLIAPPAAEAMIAPEAVPVAAPAQKSAELATFFNDYDKAELELSPLSKSYRAIKDEDYGDLDQYTDAAAIEGRALDQRTVAALQSRFDRAALTPDDQLSYDLLLYRNTRAASIFPYRRNAYVLPT
jgi:uncharacterized protein (DUF885 family)